MAAAMAVKAPCGGGAHPRAPEERVVSAFLVGFVDRGEAVAAAVSAAAGKPAYATMDEVILLAAAGRAFAAGVPEWLADDTSRSWALINLATTPPRLVAAAVAAAGVAWDAGEGTSSRQATADALVLVVVAPTGAVGVRRGALTTPPAMPIAAAALPEVPT
ncbi:hypothetical protein I4F81_001150 [Pyropia yezoensis]|uniref:Uncharacterized protein n=1 Tax=Pyropia yezoensis TaxID=2788 RepID=A0ACC3BLF4_PYRYE|nr:hypothetical protein I4F81_001150 [Neopyropia yezoensis]